MSQAAVHLSLLAAYLLPVVLLGLLLGGTRLANWQKGLLLAALPLFYIAHYEGIQHLAGWPSQQSLPDRFQLLGQQVREPDPQGDEAGYIRLWVQAEGTSRSRLYQLPYSKEMHQRLAQAAQREAQGHAQNGVRESDTGERAHSVPEAGRFRFEDRKTRRPPPKLENAAD